MIIPDGTEDSASRPLVSIGLPVYNGGTLLDGAIRSLRDQDYPNLEIVISDNASTDQTREVCLDHVGQDSRIRYHRVDENRGASWNFNQVFKLSRGEFFMWAAHDDLWAPSCIRRCAEVLIADPGAALCHHSSQPVDPSGDLIGDPYLGDRYVNLAPSARDRWRTTLGNTLLHASIYGLIRRSAMERTGLCRICVGADFVLIAELSLHGSIRQTSESLSWKRMPVSMAEYRSHEEMLAYLGQSKPKQVWFPWLSVFRQMISALKTAELDAPLRRRLVQETRRAYISEGFLATDFKHSVIKGLGSSRYQRWSRALRPSRELQGPA